METENNFLERQKRLKEFDEDIDTMNKAIEAFMNKYKDHIDSVRLAKRNDNSWYFSPVIDGEWLMRL